MMLFEPRKYTAVFFSNNVDIAYEPQTIQKLYLNLMEFNLIPGNNQEFELPKGTVINRLKFYTVDNSFIVSFRTDRTDIECNAIGKSIISCKDFCEKVAKIIDAIEKTHPRKSNRMAFVSTYRNEDLSDSDMKNLYENAFGKLSRISEHLPIEWNHRTCRRYNRSINGKQEVFNNIYNLSRVSATDMRTRIKHDFIELATDINTNPENVGVRFSSNDYKSFMASIESWNTTLLEDVNSILENE